MFVPRKLPAIRYVLCDTTDTPVPYCEQGSTVHVHVLAPHTVEILGGESGSDDSGSGSSGDDSSEENDEEAEETKMEIEDMTDAKLLELRRNIYLTIMSSANYEECVHKLVKNLKEGSEVSAVNGTTVVQSSQRRSDTIHLD